MTITLISRRPASLTSTKPLQQLMKSCSLGRSTWSVPATLSRASKSILSTGPTTVSKPLSTVAYQLLPTPSKAGGAEDALFAAQAEQVRVWWSEPRFEGIKRPYSVEDVVSKRGTLQQVYPSSLMAKKLWELLERTAAKGNAVHTRECFVHVHMSTETNKGYEGISWCNRPDSNDPTCSAFGCALCFWVGMLFAAHVYKRSQCRFWRLSV